MFFVHQYRLSYGKSVGVLCFLGPIFFVGDGDESAWMTSRARRDTAIAQTTQAWLGGCHRRGPIAARVLS